MPRLHALRSATGRNRRQGFSLFRRPYEAEHLRPVATGCNHGAPQGLHRQWSAWATGSLKHAEAGDVERALMLLAMAEVVVFHHALGLTDPVRRFAAALRDAGHTVRTPDLYDGAGGGVLRLSRRRALFRRARRRGGRAAHAARARVPRLGRRRDGTPMSADRRWQARASPDKPVGPTELSGLPNSSFLRIQE